MFAVNALQDSGSLVSCVCSVTLPWSAMAFAGADASDAITALIRVADPAG